MVFGTQIRIQYKKFYRAPTRITTFYSNSNFKRNLRLEDFIRLNRDRLRRGEKIIFKNFIIELVIINIISTSITEEIYEINL